MPLKSSSKPPQTPPNNLKIPSKHTLNTLKRTIEKLEKKSTNQNRLGIVQLMEILMHKCINISINLDIIFLLLARCSMSGLSQEKAPIFQVSGSALLLSFSVNNY